MLHPLQWYPQQGLSPLLLHVMSWLLELALYALCTILPSEPHISSSGPFAGQLVMLMLLCQEIHMNWQTIW